MSDQKLQSDRHIQIWDAIRAFFLSAANPFRDSVAMLVMIHVYNASDAQKTLLSLLLQGGLFISIPLVAFVRLRQIRIAHALAGIYFLCATLALVLSYSQNLPQFILATGLILLLSVAAHPLLIQLYSGYSTEHRGRKTATSFLSGTLGAIAFGAIFGALLDQQIEQYRLVAVLLAVAMLISAGASIRLPRITLPPHAHSSRLGFNSLGLLRSDKLFCTIIIAWFFLGFSNHWLLMYRTNYFVEGRFGFSYTATEAMLLVVILPATCEVMSYYFFGKLFDGMNFIRLRLLLNCVHALYLALVFLGSSWQLHMLGMVCFGLHRGGGKIIWNLWVTKIADESRIADYMAVHGFFTGIRMILGPAVGLYSLAYLGPQNCTYISLMMVIVASIMFYGVANHPRVTGIDHSR